MRKSPKIEEKLISIADNVSDTGEAEHDEISEHITKSCPSQKKL